MSRYKYTDREEGDILRSITVLVDTREKANKHITDYFDKAGIKWEKKALKYGDYSFFVPANPELAIDRDLYFDNEIMIERKGSLEELSSNLTQERDRIEKEFALAPPHKVLLIENASYEDIVNGNYDTSYNNKAYWATVHALWHKYNIPTFFMKNNKYSGFFIRGYFTYYLKESMK